MAEVLPASPLDTYIAHLHRNELACQFSPSAQQVVFYPRVIAPRTGAADLQWRVSAGLGTVHATTVAHAQDGASYNVCLIDVDEGFRGGRSSTRLMRAGPAAWTRPCAAPPAR